MTLRRISATVTKKHMDHAYDMGACDAMHFGLGDNFDVIPQWQMIWAEGNFTPEMHDDIVAHAEGLPIWICAAEGSGCLPGYGYGDSLEDGSGFSRGLGYGLWSRDGSGRGDGSTEGSFYGYGSQYRDGSGDVERPEDGREQE